MSLVFWYLIVPGWVRSNEATLISSLPCSAHHCLLSSSRLREQLADLYQAIHSSANRALLQQYEEVVHSLLSHVQENRQECERMETSLMRWEPSSFCGAWKLSQTSVKVLLLGKVEFLRLYNWRRQTAALLWLKLRNKWNGRWQMVKLKPKSWNSGRKKIKFSLKLSTRIRFVLNVPSAFISAFVAFV